MNIIKGESSCAQWNGSLKEDIEELFKLAKTLGGTFIGEYDLSLEQKEYLPVIFDPNNILNT